MGLNTYPSNPFPPSTDRMDADALEKEVSELNSNLTNYEATTNAALAVPENTGKNLIPLSLDNYKTYSTTGTWASNVYSVNGIDFTVNTDASGAVTSISASGTASALAMLELTMAAKKGTYTLNGCPSGGSAGYYVQIYKSGFIDVKDRGDGVAVNFESDKNVRVICAIGEGLEVTDLTFYPMLRLSSVTDATFAPYIPSVESRIEAVENGLTNQGGNITPATNVTNDTVDYSIISRMGNVVTVFVSLVIGDSISAWNKLADLSAGFRPIHTTMAVGWMTTTSEPCLVRIGDDGSIMISKALSTGKVQFSASYIVN